jgi:hypothetical protein
MSKAFVVAVLVLGLGRGAQGRDSWEAPEAWLGKIKDVAV